MKKNLLITGFSMFIQIVFVFGFLVIFYFLYVTKIERDDFGIQMNLIIDDLMDDVIKAQIIPKDKLDQNYKIVISGIIDTLEEDIKAKSEDAVKSVNDANNKLKNNMYKIVIGLFAFVFVLIILFRNYIPYTTMVKEAIIVTLFIGLTELVFLSVVSSKYISASPNKVKYQLGQSISAWIHKNKLI